MGYDGLYKLHVIANYSLTTSLVYRSQQTCNCVRRTRRLPRQPTQRQGSENSQAVLGL
jgi:hypothetical protein